MCVWGGGRRTRLLRLFFPTVLSFLAGIEAELSTQWGRLLHERHSSILAGGCAEILGGGWESQCREGDPNQAYHPRSFPVSGPWMSVQGLGGRHGPKWSPLQRSFQPGSWPRTQPGIKQIPADILQVPDWKGNTSCHHRKRHSGWVTVVSQPAWTMY